MLRCWKARVPYGDSRKWLVPNDMTIGRGIHSDARFASQCLTIQSNPVS